MFIVFDRVSKIIWGAGDEQREAFEDAFKNLADHVEDHGLSEITCVLGSSEASAQLYNRVVFGSGGTVGSDWEIIGGLARCRASRSK